MKISLIIGLLLYLITLPIHAQELSSFALKTDGDVTPSQQKLLTNAFLYLNKVWGDQGKSVSRDQTVNYFTPDTTLIINGKKVYTGYTQQEAHFQQVSKTIKGKIRFPLLEVMSLNNKLIVHFDEDIHDNNGTYFPTNSMAIFTLKNGRIQQWEEVVYSQYFCQAEAATVVYSHQLKSS